MFTPPSIKGDGPNDTKGTIQLPGSVGGADWQGGAFDPETGHALRAVDHRPVRRRHHSRAIRRRPISTSRAGTREYPPAPLGLPLLKPPYGRITAIDLNKGEHRVDGAQRRRTARPSAAQAAQPAAARATRAAARRSRRRRCCSSAKAIRSWRARNATAARACRSSLAPGAGGRKFRAFDKATGAVLWETELPAGTTGAPMTYMFEGKQYIVVAIGSREHPAEYVALSLMNARLVSVGKARASVSRSSL